MGAPKGVTAQRVRVVRGVRFVRDALQKMAFMAAHSKGVLNERRIAIKQPARVNAILLR